MVITFPEEFNQLNQVTGFLPVTDYSTVIMGLQPGSIVQSYARELRTSPLEIRPHQGRRNLIMCSTEEYRKYAKQMYSTPSYAVHTTCPNEIDYGYRFISLDRAQAMIDMYNAFYNTSSRATYDIWNWHPLCLELGKKYKSLLTKLYIERQYYSAKYMIDEMGELSRISALSGRSPTASLSSNVPTQIIRAFI